MSLSSCFQVPSEAKYVSKEIERQLKEAKREAKSQVKLLVLGTAESGKSTFIKQMRIIHGKGYSHEEKKGYISLICQNVNMSIKMLISAMERLGIKYEKEQNRNIAKMLTELGRNEESRLSEENAQLIWSVWQDEGIQKCYLRRNEFHLYDSASYYLSALDRIGSPTYVPTLQDILRTRVPTSGIVEYLFDIDRFVFGIVDVGGQKSERRKWIHCFENVTSIIFLAALSEYDQTIPVEEISQDVRSTIRNLSMSGSPLNNNQHHGRKQIIRANSEQLNLGGKDKHKHGFSKSTRNPAQRQYSSLRVGQSATSKSVRDLPPFPRTNTDYRRNGESPKDKRLIPSFDTIEEVEPPAINRLEESCALFKTIVENPLFKDTSVILFLNKTDILEEKIKHSPLSAHFSSFQGPDEDIEAIQNYILHMYVNCFHKMKHAKRTLYTHFTCATDTNNIRFVFAVVKDIILQSYLVNCNLA